MNNIIDKLNKDFSLNIKYSNWTKDELINYLINSEIDDLSKKEEFMIRLIELKLNKEFSINDNIDMQRNIEVLITKKTRVSFLKELSNKLNLSTPELGYPKKFFNFLFVVIGLLLALFIFLVTQNLIFVFTIKLLLKLGAFFFILFSCIIFFGFPPKNFDNLYTYEDFLKATQKLNLSFTTKNRDSLRSHIEDIINEYERQSSV